MAVVTSKPSVAVSERTLATRLFYPQDAEGIALPPWKLALAVVVVAGIALGLYRWYMEATAFTVGLDYFEPEFQTYWMSWLYAQGILIVLIGMIGIPALWFTRPTEEEVLAMSAKDELSWYVMLFTFMAIGSFLVVCVLGIWVEADAAWHQVTIRDTDFTPTHIQLFYGLIPMAAVGLVLGLLWIHTRMPDYVGRFSIPLGIAASAPLLIMPNLGYNEWGHTFFYAEELFAAPIHWGFVFLGWSLFFLVPLAMQIISHMARLIAETTAEDYKAAA